ncbi:MAG TPA: tetratricopeptide repeat protein [Anaerolineae bacterium]|nr:tetratricopeptide repeat protein [Anaerolineae bacterium]
MHNLIPHFITQQYQLGHTHGQLHAATLFLDISGFTTMTQTLMTHGKEGAEIVAALINKLFNPIINTIHQHGGFVTGFAGDAVTALFPYQDNTPLPACTAAIHTALTINHTISQNPQHQTKFGTFHITVKQGISLGPLQWGIGGTPTQKTYYFYGPPLTQATHAETHAQRGQIILATPLHNQFSPNTITTTPLNPDYVILHQLDTPPPTTTPHQPHPPPTPIAHQFFPAPIWQKPAPGEFRDMVAIFLSFRGLNHWSDINQFLATIITLTHRFDGYFCETDFGDKGNLIIIYFGAPTMHENDIQRALRFLQTLRHEPLDPRLQWRAGVTFGTVYAGYIGSPQRDKYTAIGNIMNLAARLMTQAQWGEIIVTQPLTTTNFQFTHHGQHSLKGFATPITSYQLQGNHITQRIFGQKLIGRDNEISQLISLVQTTLITQKCHIVYIYGDAGSGKSHLSHTFAQAISERFNWFTGQTDPILHQALNPFVYFLRHYFSQSAQVTPETNKQRFQHRLDQLLTTSSPTSAPHNTLHRAASCLGALIGLHWPNSLYEQLDDHDRYQNSLQALIALLQLEAQQHPFILELEDAHWFDQNTRQFLPQLCQQLHNTPVIILITSRYQDDGQHHNFNIPATLPQTTIDLHNLSPHALRRLARLILGTAIDDTLYQFLHNKTNANPFFIQEMLRYLQENDLLQQQQINNQTILSLATHQIALPTSLNTLLIARLDRLSPSAKEIVHIAAVLGREFDTHLLQAITPHQNIDPILQQAAQLDIWFPLTTQQYMFKHLLFRDAAYDMQLREQLRHWHHAAATTAEQLYHHNLPQQYTLLAYHYEQAYQLGHTAAYQPMMHYLLAASRQATTKFEHYDALNLLRRGHNQRQPDDHNQHYQLLLIQTQIYSTQSDRERQRLTLDTLEQLIPHLKHEQQTQIAIEKISYHLLTSQYAEAINLAQQTIADNTTTNDRQLANVHRLWGNTLQRQSQLDAANQQLQQALTYAQQTDNPKLITDCLTSLGNVALDQNNHEEARHFYQQALTIAQQTNNISGQSDSVNGLGIILAHQNKLNLAQTYFEQALHIRQKMGARRLIAASLTNLGFITYYQGNYTAAHNYLTQSLPIRQAVNDLYGECISRICLGHVLTNQTNYQAAHDHYTFCLDAYHHQLNNQQGAANAHHFLATIALAQNQLATAAHHYHHAQTIYRDINQIGYQAENWVGLGRLHLAQNDPTTATHYAQKFYGYYQTTPQLTGLHNPMRTLRYAWELFTTLGQPNHAHHILTTAYHIILEYLTKNDDPTTQTSYLQQPDHHILWQIAQQQNLSANNN